MSENDYFGHATMADGTHVPLSQNDAKAIWEAIDAADAKRRADMPTTQSALSAICDGKQRLTSLGWRDAVYCPKDGSSFAIIEYGSTGIFYATYHGEWPTGSLYSCDHFSHPRGAMFKALADLSPDERSKLDECDALDRQMSDREMRAFAGLTEAEPAPAPQDEGRTG